jgi:cell division cycle 14
MFERVDMGDFNWISPNFLAFASPQHAPVHNISPASPEWASLPKTMSELRRSRIPKPFQNVVSHFVDRNIGLVVRLNSQLYSASYFTAMGIQHLDMIFDDGTCPPLSLVRRFINLAHEMITIRGKGIAVHCKAGLGRTGCLIGAYLIYRHNFTANEVISYMRFMRPGMVVGPQQHWLHLNQHEFKKWWHEDTMKIAMPSQPSTPTRLKTRLVSNGQTYTPPPNGSAKRAALGEIMINEESTTSARTSNENLPVPTPGQPRKTSKVYGANSSRYRASENEPFVRPDTEVISTSTHRHHTAAQGESESDEEFQLRMLARRASRSPTSSAEKRRAVSCTSTTTVTTTKKWDFSAGETSDVENAQPLQQAQQSPSGKARTSNGSGNGKGEIAVVGVTKVRGSPIRRSTTTDAHGAKTAAGVRKTSGRVGSHGTAAAAAALKAAQVPAK